jgi:hypothetical protein
MSRSQPAFLQAGHSADIDQVQSPIASRWQEATLKSLALTFSAALAVSAAVSTSSLADAPSLAAGDWIGTVTIGGVVQQVAVHIHRSPPGGYTGTIAVPQTAPAGEPLRVIAVDDGTLALRALGGVNYRASWDPNNGQWIGALNQHGMTYPMILRRDDDQSATRAR